jgi:glycosyltransferase involved in cell wall biosynthesis
VTQNGSGAGVREVSSVVVAHPSSDLYGSDRMMLESVAAFLGRGWRVTVTVPSDGPLVPQVRELGAQVVLCPTVVLRKSALRPRGLVDLVAQCARSVRPALRLLRAPRTDVLYVSTVTIPLWVLLARLARVRCVVHVHEAEGSAPRIVRRVLTAPLLLADGVLVNSRFSRDVLGSAFASVGRRAVVVPNGVAGPGVCVPARPSLDGGVRLLYVGRLSPRKGVDVAVEALGRLRAQGVDAGLDVVGAVFPGYEWFQAELEQTVLRLGLTDHVRFHGFRPDVWSALADCDVVLVPSTVDEPFGNTAVEAVLAARPLVVSRTSGLREAADGFASARFVEPADPQALADAVADVVARGAEV